MSFDGEVPKPFICPITQEIMKDPVILSDGHTYERDAIEKWFETKDTSPTTNLKIAAKTLTPNVALRQNIEEWREENGDGSSVGTGESSDEEPLKITDEEMQGMEDLWLQVTNVLVYLTFGPSSWENVDGWEEGGQDISEYYGVTVSTEGTLIRIKLTKNNLEGGLPETIGQLTALMILNLSSNFIEGPLPPSITDMVSLNKLELSRNRFSGEIPETIGEMTNLKKIVLQNNKFSGEIPKGVCSIAALLHCDFSRNDLIGTVPEEFGYMDGLRALLINDNRMTGDVPESLTLLTNIEVLRLEFNKFEIDPHWLVEVNVLPL